jgi:D-inositol-3-phosphate glycosyltransferase
MGLLFYPRGGSAQVARYLSRALEGIGWSTELLSGSLGRTGEATHAGTFYESDQIATVDYDGAVAAFRLGRDPIAEPVPMHPSYEDRPDVPDRVLASVSPELGDRLTAFWEQTVSEVWSDALPVFHLHHLTPIHEAVMRRYPGRPVVTNLHGTETKLIDRIQRLGGIAQKLGTSVADLAARAQAGALAAPRGLTVEENDLFHETRWACWAHADHWADRLRAIAARSDRLIVNSPQELEVAARMLSLEEHRFECIPNGIDTDRFDRRPLDAQTKLALWRRWLVEDPHGWDESGKPGTVRYSESQLEKFVDSKTGGPATVLLFVGRFLAVKRLPLLLRAYARARPRFTAPAPLVIWGGFPGEWEEEHPCRVASKEGIDDVFFAGWRGHEDLPAGLGCADVFVGPSIREGFGQVFIEAMACGLPVIAARSGGPVSFVNTEPRRPNGWMVEPDDIDELSDALVEAVNDPDGRRARAQNAYAQIHGKYSWRVLAERFARVYEEASRAQKPTSG